MSYDPLSKLWIGIMWIAIVAILLVVEVVLLVGRGMGKPWPTISIYTKDGSLFAAFAPWVYGLMGGHFFLTWDVADKRPWFQGWPVWVAVTVALIAWDALLWGTPHTEYPTWMRVARYPGLWFILGAAAGALTWPQRNLL